jgi:hypothetical protein
MKRTRRISGLLFGCLLTLGAFHGLRAAGQPQSASQVLVENDHIQIELTKHPERCMVLTTGHDNPNPQDMSSTCTELAITNKWTVPMTAWVAITETDLPEARHTAVGVRSSDTVASCDDNLNNPQILARDTHRVIMGTPTRVDFKAAVFSDGSVFGDPEWVKRIIQNRRQIYQDTVTALQKLRAAQKAGTPREQLVQEFRELERQEEQQKTQSRRAVAGPASLMLTLCVYGSVASNLWLNHDPLSRDIERLESWMLQLGGRLLMSKPPISEHSVPVGAPPD